jgi:hypothetical protein
VLVLVLVLDLLACSPAAAPSAAVEPAKPSTPSHDAPPPPASADTASASVEDAAMAFISALERCQKREVLARSITYEELTSMTKKEVERKEFDAEISDFVDARCHELAAPHPKFVGVNVVERKHLVASESEKIKRDVDAAIVRYVTEEDGKKTPRGITFIFFLTDAGWKFSPKH